MPDAEEPTHAERRTQLAVFGGGNVEQPDKQHGRDDKEKRQLKRRVGERRQRASNRRDATPLPRRARGKPILNARERDICWLSVQTRIPFAARRGVWSAISRAGQHSWTAMRRVFGGCDNAKRRLELRWPV